MVWNITEISVWNMENARIECNERFQEWNGRQSSILIQYYIFNLVLKKKVYANSCGWCLIETERLQMFLFCTIV